MSALAPTDQAAIEDLARTVVDYCHVAARDGVTFDQAISFFTDHLNGIQAELKVVEVPRQFAARWLYKRTVAIIDKSCLIALGGEIFMTVPSSWPSADQVWRQRKKFDDASWEAALNFFGFARAEKTETINYRSIYDADAPERLYVADQRAWMLGRYVVRQPFHSEIGLVS